MVFHGLPVFKSTVEPKQSFCVMKKKKWRDEAPFLQDAFQIDPIEYHVLEIDVDNLPTRPGRIYRGKSGTRKHPKGLTVARFT